MLLILLNKNTSNYNSKSTFGMVKLNDGTEINTVDAATNNGPNMVISYTTPSTQLTGSNGFMKYPIMYLVTDITDNDTTNSDYIHPGVTVLLSNIAIGSNKKNLIDLSELYNNPTTYFKDFTNKLRLFI